MPNLYQASVRNLHTITSCYRSGLPYPCSFYNDHIIYYLLTGGGQGSRTTVTHRDQRTARRSQFSPSASQILEDETQAVRLGSKCFTC